MDESVRLDVYLVREGLCGGRGEGVELIKRGKVMVNGGVVRKASKVVKSGDSVVVDGGRRYVSRGGEKLAGALERFGVSVAGKVCLDVGASTGGFTDCLLQAGAAHVTCVDVGRGQLVDKIAGDDRVESLEGVNARELESVELPYPSYDVVVMDLSFISVRLVLEGVWDRVMEGGVLLVLIKPQFEVGKIEIDRCGGVVKDDGVIEDVLDEVRCFIKERLLGAREVGLMESVIRGGDGNREYLVGVQKEAYRMLR